MTVLTDISVFTSQTLAKQVTDEDIKTGRIYPHVDNIKSISLAIACEIVALAHDLRTYFLLSRQYGLFFTIVKNISVLFQN